MTQTERVLEHLRTYGSIEPLDALREYGIMRLSSRVTDLKRQGYAIRREMVQGTNKFGECVHWARYIYEEEDNEKADQT